MSIEALVEVSRFYGSNPDYVIAGGGNTSFKDDETLYIKGSGMALADAVPEAFVRMDRKALAAIWEKSYPAESAERERAVLADLLAARMAGEEQKRPSVETMLHDLLPNSFVVHLHPALVNGMTCSNDGETAMKEIFPGDVIWIPSTNPGYVLSQKVNEAMHEHHAKHGRSPGMIFLQNHGIFVGGHKVEAIKKIYQEVISRLENIIKRRPDFSEETRETFSKFPLGTFSEFPQITTGEFPMNAPGEFASILAEFSSGGSGGGCAAFLRNTEIANLVKDRSSFAPVSSAFTPDHIVYSGSDPLFIETQMFIETKTEAGGRKAALQEAALREAWDRHLEKTGRLPKIAAIQGLGVFGLGASEKTANLALELFRDAVRVAVYSGSFGGPRFMDQDQIDFINNWEVEAFRSKIAAK